MKTKEEIAEIVRASAESDEMIRQLVDSLTTAIYARDAKKKVAKEKEAGIFRYSIQATCRDWESFLEVPGKNHAERFAAVLKAYYKENPAP